MKIIILFIVFSLTCLMADSIPDIPYYVKSKTCNVPPFIICNKTINVYLVTDCIGNMRWIETDKKYNVILDQIIFTATSLKEAQYILNKTIVERKIPIVKSN